MKPKIEQLTSAEQEWIADQIAMAKEFVRETIGKDSDDLPSAEDLDQAFGTWLESHDPAEANSVVNCVGAAFGQHLVNTTPLEWVIATDEYGTELAVYGLPGEADILVFPQNFVAKRYESKVGEFIVASLNQFQKDIADVETHWRHPRDPNSKKPWWKLW